jgi:hypothetical protein
MFDVVLTLLKELMQFPRSGSINIERLTALRLRKRRRRRGTPNCGRDARAPPP